MRLTFRNELVVLVGALLLLPVLATTVGDDGLPVGVLAEGTVAGAGLAMQAVGIVLVYRSHRFINFGQVYIGAVAAYAFTLLVQYGAAFRWIQSVCPVCLDEPTSTMYWLNYWGALVVALGLSVGLAWLVYVGIVKRFEGRSRLVVMVATIFLGPAANALVGFLQNSLTSEAQRLDGLNAVGDAPLPFDVSIDVGGRLLHAPDLLLLAAAVASTVGLYLFLRFSALGTVIRASSESEQRATQLGINVDAANTRIWVIVGFLSGVPAILGTMHVGGGEISGLDPTTAVAVLLIAVIARLVSLPMAAVGGVVFGVVQQSVFWVFRGSTAPFNASLVLVIGVLLLLRSREVRSRAEAEDGLGATREINPIPRELAALPSLRQTLRTLRFVLVAVVVAFPWAMSPAQTDLTSFILINAVMAMSLLVLTGWAGQVSLGQYGFAAVGAWVVGVWQGPFLLALAAAAAAGAVVAVLVGIPALRLRGLNLAVSTLAFAVSVSALLLNPKYLGAFLPQAVERPLLFGMDFDDQRVFFYFTVGVLALVVLATRGLRRSRTGRVLIGLRDNERVTQSFGVNLVRARLQAFAIAGGMAAFAGGMLAYHQTSVSASSFTVASSFNVFTMAVIGGLGSVAGPILGALYNGIFVIFGGSDLLQVSALGFGGLALLVVAPGGLSQLVFGVRDAMLRRVAKRHRIVVPSLVADVARDRVDGRVSMTSKSRHGGGTAFVPRRYGLDHQWAVAPRGASAVARHDADFAGVQEREVESVG